MSDPYYGILIYSVALLWLGFLLLVGFAPELRKLKHPTIVKGCGDNSLKGWVFGFVILFAIEEIAYRLHYELFAFVFVPVILVFFMMFLMELTSGEIIKFGEKQ